VGRASFIWVVSGVVLLSFTAGYVEQSFAASSDTFTDDIDHVVPYVADQEMYDSNLYRLPSYITDVATLIAPNASREDYINTVYAGVDGQWTLAQQAFGLNLRVNENRFARNSDLDNYSGNLDLLWDWSVGGNFSGQVGGDYTRSLANFAETLYFGRDLVDVTDYFGSGRYQLGPQWAIYGNVRETETTHSAVAGEINDFRSSSGKAGVELATSIDNTVSFEYRYATGVFPSGLYILNGAPFDRNYRQDTESVLVKYVLGNKTVINANAGYLKRDYTNESIGAFSGDVWRVSLQWQATEKTQISFAVWRELQAYLASESDYFVATGGSVSPIWMFSEKLTFSLTVSTVDQNYIGTSPSVLALGSRHDKVNVQQASIIYTPTRALMFNFSYSHQQRDSNQAAFEFDETSASAAITFKF
jgi:hypothetical protein